MTNTRYIGAVNSFNTVDRLTPREGYKVVMIKTPDENGKIQLVGPHFHSTPYDLSADSTCQAGKEGKNHDFENCTCGFYSYTSISDTLSHWRSECGGYANQAIVKVALSQKVVVCEKGYRASHQRTMKILMPHCWLCSKAGTFMVPHKEGFFVAGCEDCVNKSKISKRTTVTKIVPAQPVEEPKKKFWQKSKPVEIVSAPETETHIAYEETQVPVRSVAYTFTEFSQKFSPEGFAGMEILSASDLGKEALAFMEPDHEMKQASEWISKMIAKNDIVGLQKLVSKTQTALDELINTAIKDIK